MKTIQLLLGVMVTGAMLSTAYADDNDPNSPRGQRQQQRSEQRAEQPRPAVNNQPAASRAQIGAAMAARPTFAPPLPLPTQQPARVVTVTTQPSQAQISNRPVGGGSWQGGNDGQGRGQSAASFSQGGLSNDNRPDRHTDTGGRWNGSTTQTTTITQTTNQPATERYQGSGQRDRWNNNDRRGNDNRGAAGSIAAGMVGAGTAGQIINPGRSSVPRWQQNQQDTRTGWNPNIGSGNSRPVRSIEGWSRDSQGHSIRTAVDRKWQNRYRMPYADGGHSRYAVRWHRGWHPDYDWRGNGWRTDYRTVDPYWFALITSMAYQQSWSDYETSLAINDDNLRQQLLYDASVRQQMLDSGFPADQVDYPPDVINGDPSYDPNYSGGYYQGYNQGADPNISYDPNRDPAYDPNYDPRTDPNYVPTSAPVYTTTRTYVTPPAPYSLDPNSPNSPVTENKGYGTVTSGEQVANKNANKNVLFFCNAKNRAETARAFKQVQSMDLSVWPDIETFNTCRLWSGAR